MPASNTGIHMGYLVGKYPGLLGHLFSPGDQKGPFEFVPYALDNGKFSCWSKGKDWDANGYIALLRWAVMSGQKPLWALVPDKVADAEETSRLWTAWSGWMRTFGWPLAFAVQDGHRPSDVPLDADVVFVGGSTEWKIKTAPKFCMSFPRVHIGRVNSLKWLRYYQKWGAESCDGTGWFKGSHADLPGLELYLEEMTHGSKQRLLPAVVPGRERIVPTRRNQAAD